MTLPKLHFLHANSYPAGTYGMLFADLARHYAIDGPDMLGHDPDYPVDDGWDALVREAVAGIEQRYDGPVILVGHSLGGMLALMVAARRPDLARCVVMLDSPVVAGWRAFGWRIAKALGRGSRFSPARFSERRRNVWPNAQAAYMHFAAKDIFAAWPDQVLRDYLAHGLEAHPEGLTLRFRREIETAIYNTLPHHLGRLARPPFPVPVGFIGGTASVECRQAGLDATRRLVGPHFVQVAGGHLFPMESPHRAAREIHAMIVTLLKQEAPHG
jgi:pimeloyl-ACP methyl ester carboxylesterase